MNKRKTWSYVLTLIYAAAVMITLFSFLVLGFSESLLRFVITLAAVLLAESAVYVYGLFWLRAARSISRTSPVIISGALITAAYAAAVLAAAVILDWLLEVPSLWYGAVQLVLTAAAAVCLAAVGIYGRNAGDQEEESMDSMRSFRKHQQELAGISALVRTCRFSGRERLIEMMDALGDKFKYSDPVSDLSLFATEDIIAQQISLLRDHVELLLAGAEPAAGWEAETQGLTESIAVTLQRRNRELAALK